jgi:PPOX class probable F420-dependent enzyme
MITPPPGQDAAAPRAGRRRPPGRTPQRRNRRRAELVEAGMIDDRFAKLLAGRDQGVLTTIRHNGRPQLSNVNYHWYPADQLIKVSVTDDRVKVKNIRRDPRVSFHVTSDDFWSYAVVEGTGDLTPVAAEPHDATVEELIDLYRAVRGEHPDWDDYRAAMVRDKRLVLRIRTERAYGQVRAA